MWHSIANIDINKDYDESGYRRGALPVVLPPAAFLAATCRRIATTAISRCTTLIPDRLSCSDDHRYSVRAPLFSDNAALGTALLLPSPIAMAVMMMGP